MAIYLLDTTTLTHLQRGHLLVSAALAAHVAETVGTTAVNVEEVIGGWLKVLPRPKTNAQQAQVSQALADAVVFLAHFPLYPVTEAAFDRYDQLVKLKLNVGKMDLKIAAVALELGATVVTNNARDFGRVPGLLWEDWSV
jgi:tRNA(fMet)-specific endonuclease VapC